MLAAAAIAAHRDRAGAADHHDPRYHDPRSGRKGTSERGPLVAGHGQPGRRQLQGPGRQVQPLGLHRAAGFDAAGPDRRRAHWQRPPGFGQPPPRIAEALPQGGGKTIGSVGCRQMHHPRPLPLRQNRAVRLGQPAGGVGLAGIKAGQEHRSGLGFGDLLGGVGGGRHGGGWRKRGGRERRPGAGRGWAGFSREGWPRRPRRRCPVPEARRRHPPPPPGWPG